VTENDLDWIAGIETDFARQAVLWDAYGVLSIEQR
jgi:hypothetical protein